MSQPHRWIENGLAVLGGIVGAVYVLGVEIFPQACYAIGRCPNKPESHDMPWGVVLIVAACVLPKTMGRASAGKVWDAITSRFGNVRTQNGNPPPPAEG